MSLSRVFSRRVAGALVLVVLVVLGAVALDQASRRIGPLSQARLWLSHRLELVRLTPPQELGGPRLGPPRDDLPVLVAHAGGAVAGHDYSNSLEALDANYALGFRSFELDFVWTADDRIVLAHDWGGWVRRFFDRPSAVMTHQAFMGESMIEELTQLDLDGLAVWLRSHPGARIVTDFKERNLEGLARIAARHPELQRQFIPQIYGFTDFDAALALGYPDLILTLYRKQYRKGPLLDFLRDRRPLAVTMDINRAREGLAAAVAASGVWVYVHTVNDIALARELRALGVDGFYTDELSPAAHRLSSDRRHLRDRRRPRRPDPDSHRTGSCRSCPR